MVAHHLRPEWKQSQRLQRSDDKADGVESCVPVGVLRLSDEQSNAPSIGGELLPPACSGTLVQVCWL